MFIDLDFQWSRRSRGCKPEQICRWSHANIRTNDLWSRMSRDNFSYLRMFNKENDKLWFIDFNDITDAFVCSSCVCSLRHILSCINVSFNKCIYIYIYIYIHTYILIYIYIHIYIHIYMCVCVWVCVGIYIYWQPCTYILYINIYVLMYIHKSLFTHTQMNVYAHTYMRVWTHICIHIEMHVYMSAKRCLYIYIYIYIYMCVCVCVCVCVCG